MNIMSPKAWLAALWIVVLATIGLIAGVKSFPGLAGLVALTVVPVLILNNLWKSPDRTTSESIKDAIR